MYPKAPERTRALPSAGNSLGSSSRRVSGWDGPTRGVKHRKTKHNGDVGDAGGVLSDLGSGLIIIVGVEVGEVCVGVGLPGQLGVEVLVSFLQDQVVFVESLLERRMETTGVTTDEVIVGPECRSNKQNPSSLNKEERKSSNTKQWEAARRMRRTIQRARAKHSGGGDKPPQG